MSHRPVVLLVGVLSLVTILAGSAGARELRGRLFLGPQLAICLEESGSTVVDFLRAIRLVSSEVPVLNLRSLSRGTDQLVVGSDRHVYATTSDGRWADIGSAKDLSCMTLEKGVSIRLVSDPSAVFSGEGKSEKLEIEVPSDRPRTETVPKADFSYWLGQLDELAQNVRPGKVPPPSYVLLFNALATSLPVDTNATGLQSENLRALKKWIDAKGYSESGPVEQLLKKVRKDVQNRRVEEQNGPAADQTRKLVAAYEQLITTVIAQ